ncbi:hypothetical protein [Streptomyces acidicola]|uniref:Uncharacterized protein n=1 Tax=Streptomyces acidicola TaxID=2596892 RepID=A0A5N8X5E5_9ACTN|nr:hypothetical protein [Streptomyces acidicola]MPY54314.1 hypothetical protein [Streptomyces acidicola]
MTIHPGDSDHSGSARCPDTTEAPHLVCAQCGTPAEDPQPTWTCSVENGIRHYFCDNCARANIRAIERRLDSAWW